MEEVQKHQLVVFYFGLGTKIKNKYYYTTIKKIFRERTRKKIQEKSTEFILKEIIKEFIKNLIYFICTTNKRIDHFLKS